MTMTCFACHQALNTGQPDNATNPRRNAMVIPSPPHSPLCEKCENIRIEIRITVCGKCKDYVQGALCSYGCEFDGVTESSKRPLLNCVYRLVEVKRG